MEKLGVIKKLGPIFLGILLCFMIFMAIKNTKEDNRLINALNIEFPNVENQDSFSGILTDYMINRGAILITVNNNYKTCINPSRNYKYDPAYLYKFICSGDSIVKKAYSDTLHVYRNNLDFYFVIGKFIGSDSIHENSKN
jgi:hypothetical protein